jgi:hypothetical protein
MNAIKIKLTFFDINDSLLCTIAFAIAAVNLFQIVADPALEFWRLVEWATLGATAPASCCPTAAAPGSASCWPA